jgi:uncharacterized protein
MKIIKNQVVEGSAGRSMLTDVFYTEDGNAKPLIIYAHGFNGFKDWANFDSIAKQFADAGFVFVKFNFSHNGTTVQQPENFADLEAFGNNNYTKQLFDLGCVIDWCLGEENELLKTQVDRNRLYLLGHSMGGGIVLLKAAEDLRVKKVTTWASIHECKTPWGSWPAERIESWRQSGVEYYANSRTNQQMPLYFQLYEDYQQNEDRLNIRRAIAQLQIPVLLCHGTRDEAVTIDKAHQLQSCQPAAKLFTVDSDHVFGRKHPASSDELPEAMQEVVNETIQFFA